MLKIILKRVILILGIITICIGLFISKLYINYYNPAIVKAFKENKEAFVAIKDEVIKDGLEEMKDIPIFVGSWKNKNDYVWFTGYGDSLHTPTVDETELQKIAVLMDKRRPYYLKWSIAYPEENFVQFDYILRGDDEEKPYIIVYCPEKKTVEDYYYHSRFIPDRDTHPFVIKEIEQDWYFIRFEFISHYKRILGI